MKFLRCICVVFAAMLLCGCAAEDNWVPKGMQIVQNENTKDEYTLYVPDDWTVDLSTGVTSAYAADRSNVIMTVTRLSTDDRYMKVSEYWSKYAQDCRNTFSDFRYLNVEEGKEQPADADAGVAVTLGGSAAQKYTYAFTVTGTEYQCISVICIRGGDAYMLHYTAMTANFEKHTEEVEKIITNFAFN